MQFLKISFLILNIYCLPLFLHSQLKKGGKLGYGVTAALQILILSV